MRCDESELSVSPSAWATVATGRNSRPPRNCAALFGPTRARSLTMINVFACGPGFGGFGSAKAYEVVTKRHEKHKRLTRYILCFFVAVIACVIRLRNLTQEFSQMPARGLRLRCRLLTLIAVGVFVP